MNFLFSVSENFTNHLERVGGQSAEVCSFPGRSPIGRYVLWRATCHIYECSGNSLFSFKSAGKSLFSQLWEKSYFSKLQRMSIFGWLTEDFNFSGERKFNCKLWKKCHCSLFFSVSLECFWRTPTLVNVNWRFWSLWNEFVRLDRCPGRGTMSEFR